MLSAWTYLCDGNGDVIIVIILSLQYGYNFRRYSDIHKVLQFRKGLEGENSDLMKTYPSVKVSLS